MRVLGREPTQLNGTWLLRAGARSWARVTTAGRATALDAGAAPQPAGSSSLDGVAADGSQIQSVTTNPFGAQAESPSISNTIVIQVTTPNSLLRLMNGPVPIDHVTNVTGSSTADVQVVRLS